MAITKATSNLVALPCVSFFFHGVECSTVYMSVKIYFAPWGRACRCFVRGYKNNWCSLKATRRFVVYKRHRKNTKNWDTEKVPKMALLFQGQSNNNVAIWNEIKFLIGLANYFLHFLFYFLKKKSQRPESDQRVDIVNIMVIIRSGRDE